jgi:hypothetical protein
MHENREISCTSSSKEQDRSAKAINRPADMNVQEKSDCRSTCEPVRTKKRKLQRRLGREGILRSGRYSPRQSMTFSRSLVRETP